MYLSYKRHQVELRKSGREEEGEIKRLRNTHLLWQALGWEHPTWNPMYSPLHKGHGYFPDSVTLFPTLNKCE